MTWPLASWLPLLQASRQLFAGKILPQPAGDRTCFPGTRRISQNGFFHAARINLFLVGRNVSIVMVSILINKDVFEPSYNDLKFMVWNHGYFSTNLIYSHNIKAVSSCCMVFLLGLVLTDFIKYTSKIWTEKSLFIQLNHRLANSNFSFKDFQI